MARDDVFSPPIVDFAPGETGADPCHQSAVSSPTRPSSAISACRTHGRSPRRTAARRAGSYAGRVRAAGGRRGGPPAGPDNLWVVPASRDLAGAAVELPRSRAPKPAAERPRPGPRAVRRTLLDCPPSLGPVSVNALTAADRVIVPVQAEYLALEGLVQFLHTLVVRRQLNPSLDLRVAITMDDDRTRLSQDVEAELQDHFPAMVLETVIPRSVRLAERRATAARDRARPLPARSPTRAMTKELASRG